MIGIYKITSPTGKHYIGQSVNIERRFVQYKKYARRDRQPRLCSSFKKYGIETHLFDVLETIDGNNLSEKELTEWLDSKELLYSNVYNSMHPQGLNLRIGKGRGHLSKETNEKNRISHLGEKNYMYGKTIPMEVRQKIREKLQGENSCWFGTHLSEERKQRISECRRVFKSSEETCLKISKANSGSGNGMFGRHHSESTIQKIREKNIGRKITEETRLKLLARPKRIITELERIHRSGKPRLATLRSVDQFSLYGEFIRTFRSMADAGRQIGCKPMNISQTCINRQKTASGFIWKYHDKIQKQTA